MAAGRQSDAPCSPAVFVDKKGQTVTTLVETEVISHTLLVRINRPEAMNAINREVSDGIGDAIERADGDRDIWVVVLTGAGSRAFSAGADLKAISAGQSIMPTREEWGFAGYVKHTISKPTIAVVNGVALGGGLEIVLASDLVVSADTASFGLPEVRQGLIAGAGGPFRLAAQLPRKIATELILTGARLTAEDALRWGLINRVVAQGTELEAGLALAETLCAGAPLAVQASKRIAYGIVDSSIPAEVAAWDQTDAEMRTVFASADAQEGPRAFIEKRAPVWTGR
jgi:crotonobetainyl-CoA hydratase